MRRDLRRQPLIGFGDKNARVLTIQTLTIQTKATGSVYSAMFLQRNILPVTGWIQTLLRWAASACHFHDFRE